MRRNYIILTILLSICVSSFSASMGIWAIISPNGDYLINHEPDTWAFWQSSSLILLLYVFPYTLFSILVYCPIMFRRKLTSWLRQSTRRRYSTLIIGVGMLASVIILFSFSRILTDVYFFISGISVGIVGVMVIYMVTISKQRQFGAVST